MGGGLQCTNSFYNEFANNSENLNEFYVQPYSQYVGSGWIGMMHQGEEDLRGNKTDPYTNAPKRAEF